MPLVMPPQTVRFGFGLKSSLASNLHAEDLVYIRLTRTPGLSARSMVAPFWLLCTFVCFSCAEAVKNKDYAWRQNEDCEGGFSSAAVIDDSVFAVARGRCELASCSVAERGNVGSEDPGDPPPALGAASCRAGGLAVDAAPGGAPGVPTAARPRRGQREVGAVDALMALAALGAFVNMVWGSAAHLLMVSKDSQVMEAIVPTSHRRFA
ncbi:unnamed protein product [Prorocentrum cordatum]|uniref:Uncharacterized protein n=1 Tax=Prorocentrum cordatum TaxID=2364126 RepID=A0ABN9RKC1_9DINO|nr:unnamed protein product [Polarella glacialis]